MRVGDRSAEDPRDSVISPSGAARVAMEMIRCHRRLAWYPCVSRALCAG